MKTHPVLPFAHSPISRWKHLLVALVIAGVAATTRGTTVIPPDFNKLVGQADYIVRAVVKSVSAEKSSVGGRHITTKVELEVRQVIGGTPPQPLVLEMLGGTVGDETMTVEGAPIFKVGDEDILFIHGNGVQFTPLVALMHGRYPVKHDSATGRDYVARSNGAPLYSEKDIGQPIEIPTAAAATVQAGAQPLSPDEFASRIHTALNQISRQKLEN